MKQVLFTDADLQAAINAGVFNKHNEITANSPTSIILFFEQWAKVKIAEAKRDIRHKAAELALSDNGPVEIHRRIMNLN